MEIEANPYNATILGIESLKRISADEMTKLLENYLLRYKSSFGRPQQIKYFETFVKGLLSNLDRKSIKPIALSFMGERGVRSMQQFFTRSKGWDEAIKECHERQAAKQLTDVKGFINVDENNFVKKGNDSAGVARQYCGRTRKTDNCQAGVFLSYASEKGLGLIGASLHIPKEWFGKGYEEKRKECRIPDEMEFKTKNTIAKEMISRITTSQLFEICCIGCDASFGSDHAFLDSIPEHVYYFASVGETENIFFLAMPQVIRAKSVTCQGKQFKYPRSVEAPVNIKTIITNSSIPWVKRTIAEGEKELVTVEIKLLRCVSCRKENRLYVPKSEIWVYIRKNNDGTVKYFISNLPEATSISELDRLATMRLSIEQCFQECKGYLGMAHYETRSYPAWHRHMQMVMIAQLFLTILRQHLKKW